MVAGYVTICLFVGFHPSLVQQYRNRQKLLTWARRTARRPELTPPKVFSPKCPNLVRLDSYEGTFPLRFWDEFPVYKPSSWEPDSWISGKKLLGEARDAGVDNLTDALRSSKILEDGANTG